MTNCLSAVTSFRLCRLFTADLLNPFTPYTWNTAFARSIPNVVIIITGDSFKSVSLDTPSPWDFNDVYGRVRPFHLWGVNSHNCPASRPQIQPRAGTDSGTLVGAGRSSAVIHEKLKCVITSNSSCKSVVVLLTTSSSR